MRRNFPCLFPDIIKCLRCNKTTESNTHLWLCEHSDIHVRHAARILANGVISFLHESTGIPKNQIEFFVHSRPTFTLPATYTSFSMDSLFHEAHSYLYDNIWAIRCQYFKAWKQSYGITKSAIKNYRRTFPTTRKQRSPCRTVRPRSVSDSVNAILSAVNNGGPIQDWIVWTSSNFLHNIHWLNSFHNDINYSLIFRYALDF